MTLPLNFTGFTIHNVNNLSLVQSNLYPLMLTISTYIGEIEKRIHCGEERETEI